MPSSPAHPSPNVSVKKIPEGPLAFPAAWLWLVDELIPAYVKKKYSPRPSWRDKPFGPEDARFFSKGVLELSELFTTDRPIGEGSKIPSYFLHPKFRSAYLLYFMPLQMAKFLALFDRHSAAIEAALLHGRTQGKLVIADLGAGPGTASMAFLLRLLNCKNEIPPIELIWIDTNKTILEDGREMAEALASQFPKLRGKLKIRLHPEPWWNTPRLLQDGLGDPVSCSLILFGHVLNEARQIPGKFSRKRTASASPPLSDLEEDAFGEAGLKGPPLFWQKLSASLSGGGMLAVEPAYKGASQNLSRLRDQLIAHEIIETSLERQSRIWGPCLHSQACPLARGRDWCHFSVPIRVPGKWFRVFSEALGSERQWLKYSYLWISSKEFQAPQPDSRLRRVLSDPMSASKTHGEVLLCEPERVGRVVSPPQDPLWRGDLILLKETRRNK